MKKAVFFSIVSVLIVILFGSMISLISDFSTKQRENDIDVTRTRIKVLNSLVQDMNDNYFEKLVHVAAKNAIVGLSDYYHDAPGGQDRIKKPLAAAVSEVMDDGILVEPIYAGSIKHNLTQPNGLGESYMNREYTLNNLIQGLKKKYSNLGMNINELTVTVGTEGITQIDPFHFEVEADIVYDLSSNDILTRAFWRGVATKKVIVSVYGVYAYDSPLDSGKEHKNNPITSEWIIDNGPRPTEPSLLTKLSKQNPTELDEEIGLGICSPDFVYGGKTCFDDVIA
ncbi:MAG: hypothetical protein ABIJ34_01005 [archaeon]